MKIAGFDNLNKVNIKPGTFSSRKKAPNVSFDRNYIHSSGEETSKKRTIILFSALGLSLAGGFAFLIYNFKKGKAKCSDISNVKPKIKPNTPKANKIKTDKASNGGSEIFKAGHEIKKAPAVKRQVFMNEDEVTAEALRRIKIEKNAEIAQDYFFDLNDSTAGKSAEESAAVFKKAFALEDRYVLCMADKINKMGPGEKTPENIEAAISAFADGNVFIKKTDETIKLAADNILKVLYKGPSIVITKDGRIFARWYSNDGSSLKYVDLTKNFMNRARGRNFS